ncbi:sugar transferase [Cellulomonas sp. URHD0024]|uniref:sugar transferase n=1 Tax=Cellulomonas sp. URHD0024 TaxID=1302620 RepID=UPI00041668B4|nr:sugar transferase [Cellulomonas sp. URHD0024]
MTLTADGTGRWTEHGADRRREATEPRRSWASSEPFIVRSTIDNSEQGAAGRWAAVGIDYSRAAVVADAACAFVVSVLALLPTLGPKPLTFVLGAAGAVVFVLLVLCWGGYRSSSLGDGPTEFQAVIRGGLSLGALLVVLEFSLHVPVPRVVVLIGIPVLLLVACGDRYWRRNRLHKSRELGVGMRRTLVVGDLDSCDHIVHDLKGAPHHGYLTIGVCLPEISTSDVHDVPVLGGIADVVQIVSDRAVETVVVAGSVLSGDALRRLSWALGRAGAQLVVAPDIIEVSSPRLTVRPTAGLSLLEVELAAPKSRMVAKSVLDRTVGLLMLLVATPVIAIAAIAIKAGSSGGVFYKQPRVGRDGTTFTMWKLRTMYANADDQRHHLLDSSDCDGVMFKMREDPRVTKAGRLLRRYSLDELPQLWNVVRGDMSLVGPRPPLVSEVEAYSDPVGRRLHVRPGLTGLWQVSGRSDLSWDESVRLDLRYVDNWSVTMDLMILWKTGRAVLRGSGAY